MEKTTQGEERKPFLGWTTDKDVLNQQREYWGAINGIDALRKENSQFREVLKGMVDCYETPSTKSTAANHWYSKAIHLLKSISHLPDKQGEIMASEPKDKTDSTEDEVAKQHLLNIWPSVASEVEEKKPISIQINKNDLKIFIDIYSDLETIAIVYQGEVCIANFKGVISEVLSKIMGFESTPVGESQEELWKAFDYDMNNSRSSYPLAKSKYKIIRR